ncbi:MarR family winged helix-turn-helix transcriptional regulator [Vibrio maritimus]|uniref:MarR family winged helix-turn-helix transcriptional regulator n=1 Tax=Vibrio maritimus TaxID=990268 RepID=UPI0040683705
MAYKDDALATPLLDESTFFLMGVAYRRFRNDVQEQLLSAHDITTEMQKALEILSYHTHLPQQVLADKLMRERSTIKRMVDNMLKRELVSIIPHPTNQKVKLIQLTSKGREVHESGNTIVTTIQSQWLNTLDDNLEAQLKSALVSLLEKN